VRRAVVAYVIDAPLYAVVAVLGLGVTYLVGAVLPAIVSPHAPIDTYDNELNLIATVVAAFVNAVVYVGVTARDSGVKRTWRSTLDRAFEVLWAVALVDAIAWGVQTLFLVAEHLAGTDDADGSFFALLALPLMVLTTALLFPEAAAAIDDDSSLMRFPRAFAHGLGTVLRLENFGRLVLITGLIEVPIYLLQLVTAQLFVVKAMTPGRIFWIEMPLQFAVTGIVSAIVGVAYREMRLSAANAAKNR
jgi:hypothetical protein